jgi:hydroxymethylglutaryl-CoA lyase
VATEILISEVGPRDGLQSISRVMPLEAKCAWIDAEHAAGVREIEVGSFVSPKLLPQMADTAAVVEHALTLSGLTVAVLVPNLRGAEVAVRSGAQKITLPFSASETHSLKNVRRTHAQMFEETRQIVALVRELPPERRPRFEAGISTAFGCTYEGAVAADQVIRLSTQLIEIGCDTVCLADSVGCANPQQIKSLVRSVTAAIGRERFAGLHLHNTRGLGLANVVAALELGVDSFDSSLGGLGGCPFAPGATGNIVTEDLVFMLEAMGFSTGIDLQRLLEVRDLLARALPGEELYGYLPAAGVPLGFHPHS